MIERGATEPASPEELAQLGTAGQPYLAVIEAPESQRARRLTLPPTPAAVRIGRGQCDLHLDVPQVSATHAELSFERNRWWIRDLGSTNGTFLDGQRLGSDEPVPLDHGQKIKMGRALLELHDPALQIARLPHPIAMHLSRSRAASSPVERKLHGALALENLLQILFAAIMTPAAASTLFARPTASTGAPSERRGPLSLGTWVHLLRDHARQQDGAHAAIVRGALDLADQHDALGRAVSERNQIVHSAPSLNSEQIEWAFVALLRNTFELLRGGMFVATWMGELVDAERSRRQYQTLDLVGDSAAFEKRTTSFEAARVEPGPWCYLRTKGAPISLAPFFAFRVTEQGDAGIYRARSLPTYETKIELERLDHQAAKVKLMWPAWPPSAPAAT